MRLPIAVSAILVALTLSACGGGSDDSGEVSDTVTSYLSALADGDGQKACDQLSSSEAAQIFQEATTVLPELRATGCADALSKLSESLGGERKALESVEVTNVKVNGDSATAEVVGGTTTVHLTKTDDTWLISGGLNLGG